MLWVQPPITFLDSDIRPFVLCAFITYKSNLIRTNWESILSNCLDGFRDIDIRRFISVKRLIRNCRDRLTAQLRRDDNVLRRTGVTGNRRFVTRYGVFKAIFRVGCLLFVVRVVLYIDLCAVRQRCSLCAADRALCIHCFFRAGHFAGAYSCFFHAVLGKGRGWHKTEHHALSKQDTE